MTTAPIVAAGAAAPPRRLHPLFILTGLGKVAKGTLGLIAAIGYFAAQGQWWMVAIMLPAYVVGSIGMLALRWARLSYRVGDGEIRIDSGIVSQQHRVIPFDRVQDVGIEQGPVARLFGLARVKLETGASAGANSDDGVLDAVALADAEAIRDAIRAYRRGAAATAGATPDDTPLADTLADDPVFAMALPRVLRAGVYNFSLALLAILGGALQTGGDAFGIDPFKRAFWSTVLDGDAPFVQYLLSHRWVTALAGVLSLVAIGLATGVVRTLLRDYGFTLTRTETGLRRRRGLLTRTDVILPLRRIQAAIVATGPIRRRGDWHALKFQSLARDEAKQGDHVAAPFARPDEIAPILAEAGLRLPGDDTVWRSVDRAFVTSHLLTLALPLAIIAAVFGGLTLFASDLGELIDVNATRAGSARFWVVGVGLLIVGLAAAGRVFAWRRYRYALDADTLVVRSGFWRQATVILPIANIQSADVSVGPIGRIFGIASLALGIAGGSGFSAHGIEALPIRRAYAMRTALLGRGA